MLQILHSLQRAKQGRLPASLLKSGLRAQQPISSVRTFAMSQVTADYRRSTRTTPLEDLPLAATRPNRSSRLMPVPDYEVSLERATLDTLSTQPIPKDVHPLESLAKVQRANNDIYAKLSQNELLITNLPQGYTKELASEQAVAEFLREQVHKDLQVKRVLFIEALTRADQKPRTAFIKVEVGSPRQANLVRSALRKTWLHDSLLKVRTQADRRAEKFDNRTVIITGIPQHLRSDTVLEHFGRKAGAVVGIELPQENSKLRALRRQVAERQDQPTGAAKEIDRKRAQLAVEDSLAAEQVHQQQAAQLQTQASELENERIGGLLRLITRLQAEGKSVLAQKLTLLDIKESSLSSISGAQEGKSAMAEDKLKELVEQNKDQIAQSLNYLRQNQEGISMKAVGGDPLADLLRLGKTELAVAYDRLILTLGDRERAIEARLRSSIAHFGLSERILVNGKDYAKELEDVLNVEELRAHHMKPEDFISVGQQVANVLNQKNVKGDDQLYELLNKTLNPFEKVFNFNAEQIEQTSNPLFDEGKVAQAVDPRIPKSLQHIFYQGSQFLPENQAQLEKIVKEQRDNMNVPFDELYHAQKKVIEDVIETEKALQAKIDSLPSPLASQQLDLSKVSAEQRGEVETILNKFQSAFTVSKNRNKQAMLDTRIKQLRDASSSGAYKFDYSETSDLQSKVDQGLISKKQAEELRALLDSSHDVNLGYAMMTFSHADEARLFIVENRNPYFDCDPLEIMPKAHLDHSQLDMEFFMAAARNSAKTTEEIKALREARQRLRAFEKDLDSKLPSRKRLQKFRRFAQALVENHAGLNNDKELFGSKRSSLDQARYERTIEQFEKDHPDIDLTAMFENDKTEAARQALHKKAYASYKAFNFLKHGVKTGRDTLANLDKEAEMSTAKKRLRDNDPYNFPELDKTVASVLGATDMPYLNDRGDTIKAAGRRVNGYSELEYVESYFGKDLTRRLRTENLEDPLFIEQKTIKEKYPLQSFLKVPVLAQKEADLEAAGYNVDPKNIEKMLPKNPYLSRYMGDRNLGHLEAEQMMQELEQQEQEGPNANTPDKLFDKVLQEHYKRHQHRHSKEKDFNYIDPTFLRKELDKIEAALGTGRFEDKIDWYEKLHAPYGNRAEVENDIIKQHYDEGVAYINATYDREESKQMPFLSDLSKQQARQAQQKEEAAGEEGESELQDAKFEPSAEDGAKSFSVRKNRQRREGGNAAAKSDSAAHGNLLKDELARLRSDSQPFVLGRGGFTPKDGNIPEQVSDKDLQASRLMASLSPEDRKQFHEAYTSQRISELENLEKLVKDGKITAEQANLLASSRPDEKSKLFGTDPLQTRIQSEANFIERDLTEKGQNPNFIPYEEEIARNGLVRDRIQLSVDQESRLNRQKERYEEANLRDSGAWFRKYQSKTDELETPDEFTKTATSGKMLDEFIGSQRSEIQEDDDDIYRQYQEMASRSNEVGQESDAFKAFKPKAEELKPEMPRFEKFFQNEADGVHPFDEIADSFDPSEVVGTYEDEAAEIAREEKLYKLELLGRLMGQTITPSEFELIQGMQANEELRMKRMLDANNEEFLENRQQARLLTECAEKLRRQKVLSGEWSEADSKRQLQNYIEQKQEDYYNHPWDEHMRDREVKRIMEHVKHLRSTKTLAEKEYHFDEGVGVSLDEHVAKLKTQYPSANVQTRRDRDGYAIVKISHKPEYKYNLDSILAMDAIEMKRHQAETLEIVISEFMKASGTQGPDSVSAEYIESTIKSLTGQGNQGSFSYQTRLAMRKLANERVTGRFQDDAQGFKSEVSKLVQLMKKDQGSGETYADSADDFGSVLDEILADKERLQEEIAEQIRDKVTEHMLGTKRTHSDFIKPKFNEQGVLAAKSAANEGAINRLETNLEKQAGQEDGPDFDREAFAELKRELAERKKLKEDMLTGTLPRFKPYLRI